MEFETIKTKEQAQQKAIDWQSWACGQELSWGVLIEWQEYFKELATKFDLADEFIENGII